MKKQTLTLITVLLSAGISFAGGSHFHLKQIVKCAKSCSEEQIKTAVPAAITYLADQKKIETTWAKAKIESISQKEFKKGPEWVVTLKNEANEIRYVFFGLDGYVTGSNSTGNQTTEFIIYFLKRDAANEIGKTHSHGSTSKTGHLYLIIGAFVILIIAGL